MVHPALVGGLVAGVAIAAILGYLYYEEHYTQNCYENMSSVPAHSPSEEFDLDESSSEEGDDDAIDRFAKQIGLRRRRRRTRRNPDENAIQEKFSHVTAMEQAMERRRRALEDERLEIERQEQDLARRRSLLSSAPNSASNSVAGSYVPPSPPSASASASASASSSTSPPASVTISLANSDDPFDDAWSVAAASATASIREPAYGAVSNMHRASIEGSTTIEEVVVVDEVATAGNQVAGLMSPRSADSWEDLDQTMSNGSAE